MHSFFSVVVVPPLFLQKRDTNEHQRKRVYQKRKDHVSWFHLDTKSKTEKGTMKYTVFSRLLCGTRVAFLCSSPTRHIFSSEFPNSNKGKTAQTTRLPTERGASEKDYYFGSSVSAIIVCREIGRNVNVSVTFRRFAQQSKQEELSLPRKSVIA